MDADDDCARTIGTDLERWAREVSHPVPTAVAIAVREFEAWFLASIESLRGHRGIEQDAQSHPEPESVRGAKEALEIRMRPGYSYMARADQPALSALFDMRLAFAKCRSFRKLVKSFGVLVKGVGIRADAWPPPDWTS
jgi:hypothetical protein